MYQDQSLGRGQVGTRKAFQNLRKEVINLTTNKDELIMAEDDKNYTIIDGKKVPVYNAKVVETIKNKRTGKVYDSKAHFDSDVADSNTDTTVDDLQQDVAIEVASLQVFGKTK
jgi:tRNA U54 and U55 pseudouridine synthase Pus10